MSERAWSFDLPRADAPGRPSCRGRSPDASVLFQVVYEIAQRYDGLARRWVTANGSGRAMLAHKNRALRIVQHITGEACIRRHHPIWIKSDGAVVEFARCFLRL